jgi:hypothetical protein
LNGFWNDSRRRLFSIQGVAEIRVADEGLAFAIQKEQDVLVPFQQ